MSCVWGKRTKTKQDRSVEKKKLNSGWNLKFEELIEG